MPSMHGEYAPASNTVLLQTLVDKKTKIINAVDCQLTFDQLI